MKREQLKRAKEIEKYLHTFNEFKKALINKENLNFDNVGINKEHIYYNRLNKIYLKEVDNIINELNIEFDNL